MLEGNLTRFHKISGVVAATRLKTFLQVESHQMFTGKFTRFWITKFNPKSPKFHRKTHHFHKSFGEFWMCKARLCFFCESLVNSPGVHQVLEIHQGLLQALTSLWKFTRFSPGFQIFHQALAMNQELSELHQVFTAVMVGMYPLVNVYIIMENHGKSTHFYNGKFNYFVWAMFNSFL
jgi:hypothetical protein